MQQHGKQEIKIPVCGIEMDIVHDFDFYAPKAPLKGLAINYRFVQRKEAECVRVRNVTWNEFQFYSNWLKWIRYNYNVQC